MDLPGLLLRFVALNLAVRGQRGRVGDQMGDGVVCQKHVLHGDFEHDEVQQCVNCDLFPVPVAEQMFGPFAKRLVQAQVGLSFGISVSGEKGIFGGKVRMQMCHELGKNFAHGVMWCFFSGTRQQAVSEVEEGEMLGIDCRIAKMIVRAPGHAEE